MTLVPLAKRFHNPVAQRVHDMVLAAPDDATAALITRMVVSKALEHDLVTHHEAIQDHLDEVIAERVEIVSKALSRSAIAKSRSGGDLAPEVAAAEVLAKAFEFSDDQRREFARRQQRDPSGRFRTMNRKISYSQARPMRPTQARKVGIAAPTDKLRGEDRARYQHAYQEIERMLRYAPAGGEGAVLSLHPVTGSGELAAPKDYLVTRDAQGRIVLPKTLSENFVDGGIIDAIELHTPIDLSVGGAAFDLVSALGGSTYAGSRAQAALATDSTGNYLGANRLREFGEQWEQSGRAPAGATRVFRRLKTGSSLLQSAVGDQVPARVQLALEAGNFVGQYGEEAAKVIGPTADRAAYRYRGVEKKPAPGLQSTVDGFRRRFANPNEARAALIYGVENEHARRPGQPVLTDRDESPLIEYFRRTLPSADLTHLQLKSGVVPPSQGVIISRNGQVVTEAVGYGDDWYLPFNLKTLSKLKGGEYVRTRTWGGPTTEDVYAGLVSGARAVTVVSHNGVYTVEFDPSFRGARRYNDKAARMVRRYGHLLDAVKSEQVTLDTIPTSRRKELEERANQVADRRRDREGYETALKALEDEEKANPQMSDADKRAVVLEFLNTKAENVQTADGRLLDWVGLAEAYIEREVAQAKGFHDSYDPAAPFDDREIRRIAGERVADPYKVLVAYGWEAEATAALERAEEDYKARQSPLRLNGEGYDKALQALKEQFPYYIANVSWQPRLRGATDTGYVKPGFNRPTEARVGYFDGPMGPDGSGNTKASAAVRNRYKDKARLVPVQAEAKDEPKTEAKTEAKAPARQNDSELVAARKVEAVRNLYRAMRNAKTWHPDAAAGIAGKTIDLSIANVQENLKAKFPTVFGEEADFIRLLMERPAEAERLLLRDVQAAEDQKLIRVDDAAKDAVIRFGLKPKPLEVTLAGLIGNPDADFDFGAAYAPGRDASNYVYEAQSSGLLDRLKIEDLEDPRLDDATNAVLDDVRQEIGREFSVIPEERLKALARDAVKARQLRRRLKEAKARQEAELLASTTSAAERSLAVEGDEDDPLKRLFSSLPPGTQGFVLDIPKAP